MREPIMLNRRNAWASCLALTGMVVAGCAGPAAPLDVGTQTAPLALVLGQLKATDTAPVGPVMGAPAPWTRPYYQPPAGTRTLPSLPSVTPPVPCPDYPPTAAVLGVGRSIAAPPVKASYHYRVPLYLEIYPGKTSTFVGDSVWKVEPQPADASTGAYDVVYTVTYGANTTKRVLRVLPRDIAAASDGEPSDQTNPNQVIAQANSYLTLAGAPALPSSMPNAAGYGLAGIYLVSQSSSDGSSFTPSVPMALMQLRQVNGATDPTSQNAESITSVGVDPTTQAVMAFRSTITNPTSKVNACGTKLEALQVTLSSPNSPDTSPPKPGAPAPDYGAAMYVQKASTSDPTHPKANVTLFGEKLDFGLQYGGLILQDQSVVAPGVPPNGVQVDPLAPPTATPSGPPPSDPTALALWAGSPVLVWAISHMIAKQATFIISEKPKYPKAS